MNKKGGVMADDLEARTLGELVRSFERFQRDVADDLSAIRSAAETAIRRDVYLAEKALLVSQIENVRKDMVGRIDAIEKDREEDRARSDRAIQLGVGGLAFPIIVVIVAAVLALVLNGRSG